MASRDVPPGHPVPDITIVIDSAEWGGTERHSVGLARTFRALGHPVRIQLVKPDLAPRFHAELDGSCDISAPDGTDTFEHAGVLRWLAAFRRSRHAIGLFAKNWYYAGTPALEVAASLAFHTYTAIEHLQPPPRSPYQRGRHLGGAIPGLGLWWWREQAQIAARRLAPSRVFTVSESIRRALIESFGYAPRTVTTVHNGVDTRAFTPSMEGRMRLRKAWGIRGGDIVFGAVGRLSMSHKGLDLAIDAFAAACRDSSRTWLVLVGDGPDREALEARARASGLGERIRFTGYAEQPAAAYQAIDYLLMPSRFEGLPLSLMEGMAAGCCPIATRVSGIPEIIPDVTLGWLKESGDVPGLVDGIAEALAQTEADRRHMAGRVRAQIVTHFSAPTQFATLAHEIMAVHTHSSPARSRKDC